MSFQTRIACLAVPLLACLSSGCGTLINMQEHPPDATMQGAWPGDDVPTQRIYGGVRYDLAAAGDRASQDPFCPWLVQALLDVPFSLVGDTVTLPLTIWATCERARGIRRGYPEARIVLDIKE